MAFPALAAALPALKTAGAWLGSNLGNIGTAFGGIASLGSMFGLGSSGGTDVDASVHLMNHQMGLQKEYTEWLNKNQYSFLREGLESAGYNPLLALGASPAQGNVSSANAQSGVKQDLSALLTAMSTTAQIEYTKALTDKTNTNTVEKIMDNFDTVTDKLGLGKGTQFLKDVTAEIVGSEQNTAFGNKHPYISKSISNTKSTFATAKDIYTKHIRPYFRNSFDTAKGVYSYVKPFIDAHKYYQKEYASQPYYKYLSKPEQLKDYLYFMRYGR